MTSIARVPLSDSGANARSVEQVYQKKTQLEHILLRPDSYGKARPCGCRVALPEAYLTEPVFVAP